MVASLLTLAVLTFFIRRELYIPKSRYGSNLLTFGADDSLTFFILGDTGSGNQNQLAVADAMEKRCQALGKVNAVFLLGDNFYSKGVSSTTDQQWHHKVEKPYNRGCLSNSPIFPILGNHDYRGNTDAQIEYSLNSSQWNMPSRFYKIDYGSLVRVIAVDTAFPDACFNSNSCSMDFWRKQAKSSRQHWTFAIGHHPLSSANQRGYGYSGGIFGAVMKPLVCPHLDAYISGHSHHLEHRSIPECKAELFTSGGGGGDLYAVSPDSHSHFAAGQHGFLEVKISLAEAAFTFFSKDLKKEYAYSLVKSPL